VLVAVDDDIGGVWVLLADGTEKQSAQALPSPFSTPMIEQHVAGDPVQPRSEVIAARHLVATSPHDQEHLRGHIRGVGRATGSSQSIAEHLAPVLCIQVLKLVLVH